MDDALNELDPPPVSVEPAKKTNKRKSSSSKNPKSPKPKSKKSRPKPLESPGATQGSDRTLEVLESFEEMYRGLIKKLPLPLWPTSKRHGAHSYTVILVCLTHANVWFQTKYAVN